MDQPSVLKVSEFVTPASSYPLKKLGKAELKRKNYEVGVFPMEGVGGYDMCQLLKEIPVTALHIDGEDVMVDDPLHWIGMQKLAGYLKGNVVIGGLGLGLILHALKALEKPAGQINVVELNKDVIDLMSPLMPEAYRSRIIHGNVFNANKLVEFNTINTVLLDVWWTKGEDVMDSIISAYYRVQWMFPNCQVYIWGVGDPRMNPAVEKQMHPDVRSLFERAYRRKNDAVSS